VETVNQAVMARAALLCCESYTLGYPTDEGPAALVDQFQMTGQLFAHINLDDSKNAYVVFRGTNSKGNWWLTNFQLYKTQFRVLDDEFPRTAENKIQGSRFHFPLSGNVHQGFYRALSWLWYGTDPIFDVRSDESAPYFRRVRRELFVAGVVLALGAVLTLWSGHFEFLCFGAILGLLTVLILIGFERGTWEGLVRKLPRCEGDPLFKFRDKLSTFENVWFVGHSLGGALAVLGFALYRSWCQTTGRADNAKLITFGAPRVGDQVFHEEFEKLHGDRSWNVVVEGDPIPETPPSNWVRVRNLKIWRRGSLGAALFVSYFLWRPYAWLWGEETAGLWTQKVIIGRKNANFDIDLHHMQASYIAALKELAPQTEYPPGCDLST
jgi:Lipase (class 3)